MYGIENSHFHLASIQGPGSERSLFSLMHNIHMYDKQLLLENILLVLNFISNTRPWYSKYCFFHVLWMWVLLHRMRVFASGHERHKNHFLCPWKAVFVSCVQHLINLLEKWANLNQAYFLKFKIQNQTTLPFGNTRNSHGFSLFLSSYNINCCKNAYVKCNNFFCISR